MSRKFNVGDRVRIVRSPCPEMIGRTAQVVQLVPFGGKNGSRWNGVLPVGTETCRLDIKSVRGPGWRVAYPHDYLEPVYDGNEKVSWSECAWQPKNIGVRA